MNREKLPNFISLLRTKPHASVEIKGNNNSIHGTGVFYKTKYGVLVAFEIGGMPINQGNCNKGIYAIHIHEGASCTGNMQDPYMNTGTHYNPYNCPHPYHSGDMPPLFVSNGYAFSMFLTDRFTVEEIRGKTVIIHSGVDDFTTQPSGNSGIKIACGEIK